MEDISMIALDWDDVVTRGAKDGYFACFRKTLKYLGVTMDWQEAQQRIMAKWGGSIFEECKELLKDHPYLVAQAVDYYVTLLNSETYLGTLSVIPGVQQSLEELNRRYTLCVVSGASRSLIQQKIMPRFNIPNVFARILSSGDFAEPVKQKPNPYMLELLLQEYGLKPWQALYVGDATGDVQMAQAAGVQPVVVLTGHLTKQEAQELGVELIIPDITHLPGVLHSF